MELARGERDEGVATTPAAVAADDDDVPLGAHSTDHPDPETATMILRRCTALAARARVDLLSSRRCGAADELVELLARIRSWEPATLTADATMTVLAAAALQDLAERLPAVGQQRESTPYLLATRIDAVLPVLTGMMEGGRVHVPA